MLPDQFADLSDHLSFALLDDEARGELRIRRPIEEITAFYEAMLPRFPDVMAYLAEVDPDPATLTERDRTLIALDVGDGSERWRARLPAPIAGPPVFSDDTALLVTLDNHLLGYALEDGRLAGDFALQSASSTSLSSGLSPLVEGERLYAAFYQTAFALELR